MKLTAEQAWEINRRNYYKRQRQLLGSYAQDFNSKYADDYLQNWRSEDELAAFYKDVEDQYNIASALRDYYKTTNNAEYEGINQAAENYKALLADKNSVTGLYGSFPTANEYNRALELISIRDDADYDTLGTVNPNETHRTYRAINALTPDVWEDMAGQISPNGPSSSELQNLVAADYAGLTEEEKKDYNAIWNKYGQAAAQEYLDLMRPILVQRDAEHFYTIGQEMPVLASALSIPVNLGGSMEQVVRIFDGQQNRLANIASSMRGGASSNMNGFESFLYNTGMSAADSVVASLMPGSVGTGMLALSAAANTQNDILLRGGNKTQAVLGGVAAGVAEAFFESFSIGRLQTMSLRDYRSSFKAFLKNISKDIVINASEEMATEIVNILSDEIIMGELSNVNTIANQYLSQGNISPEEAYAKAILETAGRVGEAAASGALMGLGMGGAGSVVGSGANYITGNSIANNPTAYNKLNNLGETLATKDVNNKDTAEARQLYSAISEYNQDKRAGNKTSKIKDIGHKMNVGQFANVLESNEVQKAFKRINEEAKKNVPQAVSNATSAAQTAVVQPTAEISKSNALEIVQADGQKLSEIYVEKDGNLVSLDQLSIEDSDLAMAYSYAATTGSVESANAFVKAYVASGENASPTQFWTAWMGIAANGQTLRTTDENMQKVFAEYGDALSEETKLAAWLSGVEMKKTASERRVEAAAQAKATWEKDGKKVVKGKIDASALQGVELDAKQKEFVSFGKLFAEALGMNVTFTASKKGAREENGKYDRTTNTIYIDIFSGIDNKANYNAMQSALSNTLSHEVVHNMRIVSPEYYDTLSEYVFETLKAQGMDIEERIRYYMDEDNISRTDAIEEIVAHACDGMLQTSATVREFMEGFYKKDKRAANRFKQNVRDVLKRLKEVFDNLLGVKAYSAEAHLLYKAGADTVAEIQKIFDQGVVSMREGNLARNYEVQGGKTGEQESAESVVKKDLENKDVMFNLRATKSHKEKLSEQYSNSASISLEELTKRYDKIIEIWERLGGELNSNFLNEWNNKVGRDRAFTVFKAQAGYKYNVELSSMCKKGVPLFEAIDEIVKKEVMKELDSNIIGKAEKEILYDILKDHHFEIPCAICYVEQARQREGVIIDAFLNGKIEKDSKGNITTFKLGWNEVLHDIEKEMKANGVDYTFKTADRSIATDKYIPQDITMDSATQEKFYNALKKVANKEISRYNKAEGKNRKLVTDVTPSAIKDVFKGTLPSNLKIFKVLFTEPTSRFTIESDLLYSSMTTHNLATAHNSLYGLFNSQGGVSGYKTKQGTVVYWGDILGKKWSPSKVRDEGGIRNQSNSDFQMYTLLDQVQMYIDFTAKGYYLQAYTKVLSELKLFGLSRGKINASLIPAVYEYLNSDGSVDVEPTRMNAGLDRNGNLLFDDFEGINHNEAFMLLEDAEYSKSIGGTCIGYSDRHIFKLLNDSRVQQIIGFHDKTDDPEKRYRGARYAKNYNGLNEAVNKDGKTVHIGFNPYVRKAEKMFTFNSKTETYEGKVEYNGKTYVADDIPKLAADLYLEMCEDKGYTPAYVDFASHENYYKLLADFSLYDSKGHYAPHRKVAYNMPNKVPFLDINGKKQYVATEDYIKAELKKELKVRDSIGEALADTSENGIIPQFKQKVKELHKTEASEMKQSRQDASSRLSQDYVDTLLSEFGITKLNDYIHIQRQVMTTLETEGFFTDTEHKSRVDVNEELGMVIETNKSGIDETFSFNNFVRLGKFKKIAKLATIRELPNVIKYGHIVANNVANKYDSTDRNKKFAYIEHAAEIDGEEVVVKIAIKKSPQKNKFWVHSIYTIENVSDSPAGTNDGTEAGHINADESIIPQFQQMSSGFDKNSSDELTQQRISTPDPSTILKDVIRNKVGAKEYGKYTESLKKYQDLDVRVRNQEKRIEEIDKEIKALKHNRAQSGKGARMDELYRQRKTAENKAEEYRNRMFAMESKELSGIVRAETEKARIEAQREASARYHESVVSRHQTEKRNRLKKIVNELDTLFTRGNKKKNVKPGLANTVEKALQLSQVLAFTDIGNDEVILSGLITSQTDEEQKIIDRYKAVLEEKAKLEAELNELREQENDGNEAAIKELRNNISKLNAEKRGYADTLHDLLEREKRILSKTKIGTIVDELAKAYSDLQNADESFIRQAYNDATEERIKKLAASLETVYLKDMTEEQLDEIVKVYKAVLKTVKDANKAFVSEKGETYTDLAERTKTEIRARGKEKDKENRVAPHVRRFMLSNAVPVWFFDTLRSNTLVKLFTNLANAEDNWGVLIDEAHEYKKAIDKKHSVKKWDLGKTFSFTLRSGKKAEVTLGQLFSLYAYAKQGDEAKNHLYNGGFVHAKSIILQDATKKHKKYVVREGSTYRLDEATLAEMFVKMEEAAPGASKYIDEMVSYLSGDLAQKGNDAAEKLYGIRLFNKSYYFPITSSADFIHSKEQKSSGQAPRLKNWGATNERVAGANNPIVINSFDDIWAKHVQQMASFATLTLPLEDIERVVGFSTRASEEFDAESVKGVISTFLGREYVDYINGLIDDMNGSARVDDVAGFMNTFMGLAKTGATAMSMSTLVQQPTSMFRAMAFIDPKYFAMSRAKLVGHKAEWAELKKYAPVAIIKEIGGYDTGLGRKTSQYLKSPEYETFGEKAIALIKDSNFRNEAIFKGPALADEITWCYIWAAVKKEVAATNKALQVGSEAYYKACGERFEYVIRRTQVYDSVLARSPLMRSKSTAAKMLTSFAGEPTLFTNMGYGAVDAVQHKEFKKARNLLAGSVASIITNAIVSSFVYAARDDDDDETYTEKYIQSLTTELIEGFNPLTYVPLLRDIWSIMLGYDIERLDVSVIVGVWNAFEGIFSSRKSPLEKIADFLGKLSTLFGVPLNNLIRESKATINLFELMVKFFSNGDRTDLDGIIDALQEAGEDSVPLLDKFI